MWGSDGEFVIDGNSKEVEWADRLYTIQVPTLIFVGDNDECDPSLNKEVYEKIADSSFAPGSRSPCRLFSSVMSCASAARTSSTLVVTRRQ